MSADSDIVEEELMTKKTYGILSRLPLAGIIVKLLCDPMLGNGPSLDEGLPQNVREYAVAHPDIFITKRLLKEITSGSKK